MRTSKRVSQVLPSDLYFNVKTLKVNEFISKSESLYSTIISRSRICDIVTIRHDPKLRNSTAFIQEFVSRGK